MEGTGDMSNVYPASDMRMVRAKNTNCGGPLLMDS